MLYPLRYGRLALFDCGPAEARGFEPPVPLKGDDSFSSEPHSAALACLLKVPEGYRTRATWPDLSRSLRSCPRENRRAHSVHSNDD
jgi:hypothetical protein